MFYAIDKKFLPEVQKRKKEAIRYLPLTAYGRKVFRSCVNAILSGAKLAEKANLPSFLIHNQERLEKICTLLRQSDKTTEQRLRSTARDILELYTWKRIEGLQSQVKPESVLAAGSLILKCYLDTQPEIDEAARNIMVDIIQPSQGTTQSTVEAPQNSEKVRLRERFDLFKKLDDVWARDQYSVEPSVHHSVPLSAIVRSFVSYAAVPEFSIWLLWD